MTARIDPPTGWKNWRSNPAKAVRIVEKPGMNGRPNAQREHYTGQQDGRVGGTYADPEVEEAYRKGLIVVTRGTGQPVTLADLEAALLIAKTELAADPENPQKRQALRLLKQDVSVAREQVRRNDPRRNRKEV